jgi:hypothetical protein
MNTHRAVILELEGPFGRMLVRSHAMTPEDAEWLINGYTIGGTLTLKITGKHLDLCDEVGRPGCYHEGR